MLLKCHLSERLEKNIYRTTLHGERLEQSIYRTTLNEKCPYSELFWHVFIPEFGRNTNQKNSEYGHFSRGALIHGRWYFYKKSHECLFQQKIGSSGNKCLSYWCQISLPSNFMVCLLWVGTKRKLLNKALTKFKGTNRHTVKFVK